jgi:hypothetical protein
LTAFQFEKFDDESNSSSNEKTADEFDGETGLADEVEWATDSQPKFQSQLVIQWSSDSDDGGSGDCL